MLGNVFVSRDPFQTLKFWWLTPGQSCLENETGVFAKWWNESVSWVLRKDENTARCFSASRPRKSFNPIQVTRKYKKINLDQRLLISLFQSLEIESDATNSSRAAGLRSASRLLSARNKNVRDVGVMTRRYETREDVFFVLVSLSVLGCSWVGGKLRLTRCGNLHYCGRFGRRQMIPWLLNKSLVMQIVKMVHWTRQVRR